MAAAGGFLATLSCTVSPQRLPKSRSSCKIFRISGLFHGLKCTFAPAASCLSAQTWDEPRFQTCGCGRLTSPWQRAAPAFAKIAPPLAASPPLTCPRPIRRDGAARRGEPFEQFHKNTPVGRGDIRLHLELKWGGEVLELTVISSLEADVALAKVRQKVFQQQTL